MAKPQTVAEAMRNQRAGDDIDWEISTVESILAFLDTTLPLSSWLFLGAAVVHRHRHSTCPLKRNAILCRFRFSHPRSVASDQVLG